MNSAQDAGTTPRSAASTAPLPAPAAWREWIWLMAFGLAYAALYAYAISLPYRSAEAACVWPADGLALGVLLRIPYRLWPRYLVMILAANLLASRIGDLTLMSAVVYGALNMVQPALCAWLMRRGFGLPKAIETVRGVVVFALVSAGVTLAAAAAGALHDELRFGTDYWPQVKTLLISDLLGIVIIAPLVLAWSREGRRHLRPLIASREAELIALFGGLVIATHYVFSVVPDARGWVPQLQPLTLPFLLWPALRFGLRGSTLAVAIYALMTMWYTAAGSGPFVATHADQRVSLLVLQAYVGMVSMMVLLSATLMTERRNAFADSLAWRQRFDAAIEASGNLVFEIHADSGRIDWAGDTRQVLGLDPQDLDTTRRWTARVHPEDHERLLGVRGKLASGELTSLALEYRVRRGDGQYILVGVNAYSVESPFSLLSLDRTHGRRIIGFVKDVTAKKHAEDERRRLEAELRQAQKMEAIGQLAGGIAHDFNNILSAILGYGELARKRADGDATLSRHLDTILRAGERGRTLVSQILTFSRKTPGERIAVDIDDVLDEVATLLRGSSPQEVRLTRKDGRRGADVVHGNATELHQLFMNLATNGLQAMSDDGVLEIDVGREHLDATRTVMQAQLAPGEYVVVRVRDHGIGIDEDTRRRMFEPFFTTKPAGQGTGLGLSLAMSIARAHGGGIAVDSVAGAGSTFTVYLRAAGDEPAAGALPRGRDERILLVDDEAPLRELAEEILVDLGYQVASYAGSEDALAAFERDPMRFDAVLSDEIMPGLTGTQMAARMRARRADLPILVITAYGGPGFELRAQQAGVTQVLRKPYRREDLARALGEVFLRG